MKPSSLLTKLFSALAALTLLALLLGPAAQTTQAAPADVTFTVTVSLDYAPGPPNGTCYNSVVEGCGLREAIVEANAATGNKAIHFSPSVANMTFYLSRLAGGPLRISGNNITIDATTSGGDIWINGGGLDANSNLFEIQGNENTLRGLMLSGWPDTRNPDNDHGHGVFIHDPSGNGMASFNTLDALRIFSFEHSGVAIVGDSSGGGSHNTVSHSLIGTANWASTNCAYGNRWDGITISGGADNTHINANDIVCNTQGIVIYGGQGAVVGTRVENSKIGTNGLVDMGNVNDGIIDFGSSGTQYISNIISGNGGDGIELNGTDGAILRNNRLGVDQTSEVALPNDMDGLALVNAHNTTIGSAVEGESRNIFSGNQGCGVSFHSNSSNNSLDGNLIGLGNYFSGMVKVPNGMGGVCIYDSASIFISTAAAMTKQYIGSNDREGIYIEHSRDIGIYPYSRIGVAGDGSSQAGNGREGILIVESGPVYVAPSVVANNGLAGIAVVGSSKLVYMTPRAIDSNGGLPIDLGNDGHTPNDPGDGDDGPNGLLNYPEVNMLLSNGFTGMACPGCKVLFYAPYGNPTANGGGGIYLSDVNANPVTGDFSYTFPPTLNAVTMLACTSDNECSEFSPVVTNPTPPPNRIYLPLLRR